MMDKLNKSIIKQIKALQNKKTRIEKQLFIVEGEKIVNELIHSSFKIETVIGVKEWIDSNNNILNNRQIKTFFAKEEELFSVSSFKTPNQVVAVAHIPESALDVNLLSDQLTLAMDDIQDPGNFGTIVRLADWFGIQNIICSENSVEVYNPKVIQSTMGAFMRLNISYVDLRDFIKAYKNRTKLKVYGTTLSGSNIYSSELTQNGLIVMGNESHGISAELEPYIDQWITIPTFNNSCFRTESLNVSVATAIICSEFRRREK
jgi:RNA methyltransferase, TrmH family